MASNTIATKQIPRIFLVFPPSARHYVKLLQLDESFGHRRLDDEPGAEAALIMERLGKDLGRLFEEADGKFSTKTTLMISIQLLECLEQLHAAGILHCDLKPENFLVGRASSGRDTRIFVVDFGQAKEYWKPLLAGGGGGGGGGGGVHHVTPMPSGGAGVQHKSPQPPGRGVGGGGGGGGARGSREEETEHQHIENDNKRHGVRGTIRYVSINAHKGKAVSRRDEIESLSGSREKARDRTKKKEERKRKKKISKRKRDKKEK